MKIFIIYASVGAGHFKAAEAIYNYFKQRQGDCEVKLVDTLQYSSAWFRKCNVWGYAFLINYAHWLWAFFFQVTSVRYLQPIVRPISFLFNRLSNNEFVKSLICEKPDVIIATHFLPSAIAAYLKRRKLIDPKLITVITDFGVHPFWVNNETDLYVAASTITKERLIREGVREEAVKVWGIPIDAKFSKKYDLPALRVKLGLDPLKFTVFIITGSFGIGPIEPLVDLLHNDVQVIVGCAKNKRLYARLKKKNYPEVKVMGFVENIQELMAAADVIITKPGGLTISEVLAMDIAPIFCAAIPGQEIENAEVLEQYGVGKEVESVYRIRDIILSYKNNPESLKRVKGNIQRIKKPFAAEDLYHAVCQSSSRPAH
jgi:processive 1,2-diacylglycerol beta-glucosyltransferase